MIPRPQAKRRLVAVVLEGFTPLDVALVTSLFGACCANGEPLYSFALCGVESGSINGAAGHVIRATHALRVLSDADVVIVPGFSEVHWADHQPLWGALRKACDRGATVIGIRNGAALLAAAGVLDGGGTGIVGCASWVAALEYFLRIVRSDWGETVANELARQLLGTSEFGERAEFTASLSAGSAFARTLNWMSANTHRPMTIGVAAARAHMSKRHFLRRFWDRTGTTPVQWLLNRRVVAARDLLANSDLELKQIAARVGFPSVRAFREQFRLRTGTSAMAYREAHRRATIP